jgi:RimJ/RimL family protein N-acetyltransferase
MGNIRMIELTTNRLLLKPIRLTDAENIEKLIFEEPEIVKGLAHDGSDVAVRHLHSQNWSQFGPDGDAEKWQECEMGLYVITDRSGTLAGPSQFMGITGVYLEKENDRWTGELFYALGIEYHGKGVMGEACAPVVERFDSLPKANSLYAVYWQVLNPASGKILNSLGFQADGTQSALEEYGEETVTGIRKFELWRLSNSPGEEIRRIVEEVSIKLGHLESEGVSSPDANLEDILSAISDNELAKEIEPIVIEALEKGRDKPGLAMLRYYVT